MAGVSSNTAVRLTLDGGEISVKVHGAYSDLGALPAGESVGFTVEREYYVPDFTRVRGPVKGTVFVLSEVPTLTVTLSEWQLAQVQYAMPGTTFGSDASSEVLETTLAAPSQVAASEHMDVRYKVKKADGKEIVIYVYDAICQENFDVEFSDTEEATYPVTFQGHYDPADTTDVPWKIVNNT